MRIKTGLLFFIFPLALTAQNRADTVQLIRNTVKWYDLDYTESEADSMIGSLNNYLLLYKNLHKTLPSNDLPFPFAFNPAPPGMKVSTKKEKIYWDIPLHTSVPANKDELAFYSIPQLASLIVIKRSARLTSPDFFLID